MSDHLYEYDYNFDFNDNVNVYVNNNGNACSGPSSSMLHNVNDLHPMFFQPVAAHLSPASSSTTSSSAMMVDTLCCGPPAQENSLLFNQSKGPFACDPVNVSSSDEFMSENVNELSGHVASSAFGAAEKETTEEHDCQSEEVVEILADNGPPKPPAPRSSKRSRAAEVHNLSEKRRRSRINEKMKALQNLIPNSNKTDKASMLEEAIEYLKQLQLRVQMLTLRNGFTFNSAGEPEPLQPIQLAQMRMSFCPENRSLHMNSTGAVTLTQETPKHTVFSPPNQYCAPNQLQVTKTSSVVNSQTSFGLDSSVQAHFRPFQPCTSSREMCEEDALRSLQLNVNPSETKRSVFEAGIADAVLFPFNTQAFGMKGNSSLEARLIGRDQEDVHLKCMERNILHSPHLTGMQTGSSVPGDNFNLERRF